MRICSAQRHASPVVFGLLPASFVYLVPLGAGASRMSPYRSAAFTNAANHPVPVMLGAQAALCARAIGVAIAASARSLSEVAVRVGNRTRQHGHPPCQLHAFLVARRLHHARGRSAGVAASGQRRRVEGHLLAPQLRVHSDGVHAGQPHERLVAGQEHPQQVVRHDAGGARAVQNPQHALLKEHGVRAEQRTPVANLHAVKLPKRVVVPIVHRVRVVRVRFGGHAAVVPERVVGLRAQLLRPANAVHRGGAFHVPRAVRPRVVHVDELPRAHVRVRHRHHRHVQLVIAPNLDRAGVGAVKELADANRVVRQIRGGQWLAPVHVVKLDALVDGFVA